MGDIRTVFLGFEQGADYALDRMGLVEDDGLETAVVISLFTDRRAEPDDPLPHGESDRRGWWGDAWPVTPGDRIGSRLWLLHREKQLARVLRRAREYALESLQWLIEDGVAESVQVEASNPRMGILALSVSISRSGRAPVRYQYQAFWGS